MKKILFATLILISSLLVLVSCNDVVPVPDTSNETPLTLEFPNDGMKINATITFENDNGKLYYKKNGETSFHEVTDSRIENIKAGDTIALFADRTSVEGDKYLRIQCSEDCFVYGNVMSLIRKDNFAEAKEVFKDAFRELFINNKNIKNHYSKPIVLPATKLAKNCYQEMFSGCIALSDLSTMRIAADTMVDYACYRMFFSCTGLHKAPVLPATTVAESCYQGMFYNCQRLEEFASLPAETLAKNCYCEMFKDCYALETAPVLPAKVLAVSCSENMFAYCYTLETAPELPATELANWCYYYMFVACSNLTEAPVLPAGNLSNGCYASMFEGCTSLKKAPDLPVKTLKEVCYSGMFKGCTSLTEAPALPAETLAQGCYANMFKGCTSLTKAPDLPAKAAHNQCYEKMFYECTSLTEPPLVALEELAVECCHYMFAKCKNLKSTPVLAAGAIKKSICYEHMFEECESLTTVICLATYINLDTPALYMNYWLNGVSATGTLYCAPGYTGLWNGIDNPVIRPTDWNVVEYTPPQE